MWKKDKYKHFLLIQNLALTKKLDRRGGLPQTLFTEGAVRRTRIEWIELKLLSKFSALTGPPQGVWQN
jgi:hypothetical protein